jgi:MFS family permease
VSDRTKILASALVRAIATGMVGVELGLFLAARGLPPGMIGVVVGSGLAGCAAAAFLATRWADAHGRRRFLAEIAIAGAAGCAALLIAKHPLWLAAAAFFGMVNGMGRDRGASLIVEQAILPSIVTDRERTRTIAWYNVLQDAGHAFGALLVAVPSRIVNQGGQPLDAHGAAMLLAAGFLLPTLFLARSLSPTVETHSQSRALPLTAETKSRLTRIAALFALDSLGGGFLTTALLSYFFFERFQVSASTIGLLFFGARVLNALSHLGAAWLARRIGLVNTMVFTHIPSSVLLITVAFAPSFAVAAFLFLLREGLVEMDVPTRQSYVLAVVQPHERTVASGITNLVRMGAWAIGPLIAGALMEGRALMLPLIMGALLKITYDILLYRAFRSARPPEETTPAPA